MALVCITRCEVVLLCKSALLVKDVLQPNLALCNLLNI